MKGSSCCTRENLGLELRAGFRLDGVVCPPEAPGFCRRGTSCLLLLLLGPGRGEGPAGWSLRELFAALYSNTHSIRSGLVYRSLAGEATIGGIQNNCHRHAFRMNSVEQ